LLGGDSIDAAAAAVGFKARLHGGKVKEQAGVQLARAARAVGLNFALVEPRNGATAADEFNPWRRPLALDGGAAVVPFVPARPVESLPLAEFRRVSAGQHCGAACLAAAAVRAVRRSGDSLMRGAARRRDWAAIKAGTYRVPAWFNARRVVAGRPPL
jgi:hypothetical protein